MGSGTALSMGAGTGMDGWGATAVDAADGFPSPPSSGMDQDPMIASPGKSPRTSASCRSRSARSASAGRAVGEVSTIGMTLGSSEPQATREKTKVTRIDARRRNESIQTLDASMRVVSVVETTRSSFTMGDAAFMSVGVTAPGVSRRPLRPWRTSRRPSRLFRGWEAPGKSHAETSAKGSHGCPPTLSRRRGRMPRRGRLTWSSTLARSSEKAMTMAAKCTEYEGDGA